MERQEQPHEERALEEPRGLLLPNIALASPLRGQQDHGSQRAGCAGVPSHAPNTPSIEDNVCAVSKQAPLGSAPS